MACRDCLRVCAAQLAKCGQESWEGCLWVCLRRWPSEALQRMRHSHRPREPRHPASHLRLLDQLDAHRHAAALAPTDALQVQQLVADERVLLAEWGCGKREVWGVGSTGRLTVQVTIQY